jgi:hypothetical protein
MENETFVAMGCTYLKNSLNRVLNRILFELSEKDEMGDNILPKYIFLSYIIEDWVKRNIDLPDDKEKLDKFKKEVIEWGKERRKDLDGFFNKKTPLPSVNEIVK